MDQAQRNWETGLPGRDVEGDLALVDDQDFSHPVDIDSPERLQRLCELRVSVERDDDDRYSMMVQ
jgi:hypothetical protein